MLKDELARQVADVEHYQLETQRLRERSLILIEASNHLITDCKQYLEIGQAKQKQLQAIMEKLRVLKIKTETSLLES